MARKAMAGKAMAGQGGRADRAVADWKVQAAAEPGADTALRRFAPAYADAFARLAKTAAATPHLSAREQALILLGVNASVTHLHPPGIRAAIRAALDAGASPAEIAETLTVISGLGVHACTLGVPALIEEFERAGRGAEVARAFDARQEAIKARFIAERGYWADFWEQTLRLAPEWLAVYGELSAVPWREGHLSPKLKEFLYIAIDAATTHCYEPGLRVHYRNAIKYGATAEEIVAVLALISQMGIQSALAGMPVLAEELARRGRGTKAKAGRAGRTPAGKAAAKARPKPRARSNSRARPNSRVL
ncbi:MAG: carboxymuconolactone decarboxylase family protein [Alphaproteobacteria bacterium]|nr:carboxymuconolactone decarboxylase family protein [Alphaproteobacteria bacterium]